MSGAPTGWCSVQLSSLIERIEAGLNVKCEERSPLAGEKGLVKISAVTWGRFDEEQSKTLPPDAAVTETVRIRPGDLLFSRANTIELVGATVLVSDISKHLYLSDKVLRLVVPQESKRWVNYAMKTAHTRKAIQEASSGNQLSMRNVSQDRLRQITIPLAPLPEQKRIADKLDSVLARVDACRDRLDLVPPLLKRFRQSVLAAATSGRLTEDWRAVRCSSEAQRNQPGSALCRLALGEEVLSIPRNWSLRKLQDLISKERPLCYGVVQPGEEEFDGTPLIRVQDMEAGSIVTSALRTISRTVDLEYKRSRVVPGDLLISIVGTIGRTAIVPDGFTGNIARAIARIAPVYEARVQWINFWLSSPAVQWWLVSSSREVARKTLNLAQLAATPIAAPSLEEQDEIVRRVETLFAFADRLEARYAAARQRVEQLTTALLAKAFRGELVPQDPNDEPASELLKRLAATRAAAPKAKRGGRLREMRAVLSRHSINVLEVCGSPPKAD